MSDFLAPQIEDDVCYLNPILGCANRCAYCYLALSAHQRVAFNEYGLSKTIEDLRKMSTFSPGKDGTVIVFENWGEPFPHNREHLKTAAEWIGEALSIGNPVHLISKNEVSEETIEDIASHMLYPKQLLFSSSISSISMRSILEPNASYIPAIQETLHRFKTTGIATGLMVNPFLPTITEADIDEITSLILETGIESCLVSQLYYNEQLLQQMEKTPMLMPIVALCRTNPTGHGLRGEDFTVTELQADAERAVFSEQIETRCNIPVFYHFSCIQAHHFGRINPDVYKTRKCANCGSCSK